MADKLQEWVKAEDSKTQEKPAQPASPEVASQASTPAKTEQIRQETWTKKEELKREIDVNRKLNEKGWKPDLDVVFEWTKTSLFDGVKIALDRGIDDKIVNYKFLSVEQKNNIKVWITDKIMKSDLVSNMLWSSMSWFSSRIAALKKGDFMAVFTSEDDDVKNGITKSKEWKGIMDILKLNPKSLQELLGQLLDKTIASEMKSVTDLLEKQDKMAQVEKEKNIPFLNSFLANPKAISTYKWEDISTLNVPELKWPELLAYLTGVNTKIVSMDANLKILAGVEKGKEQVMNALMKVPDFFCKWILNFLLNNEFLWKFLAEIFWLSSGKELFENLSNEIDMRKSMIRLRAFWKSTEDGKTVTWENNWTIEQLKDKDLTGLNYKQKELNEFLKRSIDKWIDITKSSFWIWVFKWGEFSYKVLTKDKKEEETKKVNFLKIENNDVNPENNFEKLYEIFSKELPVEKTDWKKEDSSDWAAALAAKAAEQQKKSPENGKYLDLSEGKIIDSVIAPRLENITFNDLKSDVYINKVWFILEWETKEFVGKILTVLATYSELIKKICADPVKFKAYSEWLVDKLKNPYKFNENMPFSIISKNRDDLLTAFDLMPAAQTVTTASVQTPDVPKIVPVQEKLDLPNTIEFDPNTSIVAIDNIKYHVWLEKKIMGFPADVKITHFSYENWSISISWKVISKTWTSKFDWKAVSKVYQALKKDWKFEWTNDEWDATLILTKVV